jgi:hypothetical protein
MGFYEGWDNVWCVKAKPLGWLCPRCEKFIPMDQEHSCETVKPEQPAEVFEAGRDVHSQNTKAI